MDTIRSTDLTPVWWGVKRTHKWADNFDTKYVPVLFQRVRRRSDEVVGSTMAAHHFSGHSYYEFYTPDLERTNPDEWGVVPNSYYNLWAPWTRRATRETYMIDFVGKASRENWIWYKPVYHVSCKLLSRSSMPALVDSMGRSITFHPTSTMPPNLWMHLIASMPQPPALLVDDLSAQAEMRFREILPASTDLLATLIETLNLLVGDPEPIRKLTEKLRKAFIKARKGYLRAIASGRSNAAAIYLGWKWGIAPLVKDIRAIVTLIDDSIKELRWIRKVAGRPTDIQFRRRDVWSPPIGTQITSVVPFFMVTATRESAGTSPPAENRAIDGYVIEPYFRFTLSSWRLDFGATGRVCVNWDMSLTDTEALRKIRRALLGLTRPWNTVWEIMPYSWLLDYVLTTRAKLERAKQLYAILPSTADPESPEFNQGFNEIPLPTQIAQGHSWHQLSSWDVEFVNADGSVRELGSCVLRVFTRQYGLPAPTGEWQSFVHLPDYWVQYLNLAAVIGSRGLEVPHNWKVVGGSDTTFTTIE